jgi:lipid II:glycine glycyltransferase (peptidoglycan interpeptide bridge formation enzyme)
MTEIYSKTRKSCKIQWGGFSRQVWDSHYTRIPRANLLQSRDYGDVMAKINQQRAVRGVIAIDGMDAGLVQILEAGVLKNAVHGVILDRGPLWFDGFGRPEDMAAFLTAFRQDYPKRFGRRVRFIPEIEHTGFNVRMIEDFGFRQKHSNGYQTIWMDLRPDMDVLRRRLQKRWQRALDKAEKAGLQIDWDVTGMSLPWLMRHYVEDRVERQYRGASSKTVLALAEQFMRGQNMMVGSAMLDNVPIAAILVFIHGSAATYQIGYTSDKGRECCAHHLLLWASLRILKEKGVNDFDLGGVNDGDAQGVKAFKQGLGGEVVETAGLFI